MPCTAIVGLNENSVSRRMDAIVTVRPTWSLRRRSTIDLPQPTGNITSNIKKPSIKLVTLPKALTLRPFGLFMIGGRLARGPFLAGPNREATAPKQPNDASRIGTSHG